MVAVAVVGAGYWGPALVRNFYSLTGAMLHTVCDVSDERLGYIGERYPKVNLTKNFGDVLRNKEIDAVCIATPADSHFIIAEQALAADKHVLVEKPLALNSRDCMRLIQLAQERERVLMTGHTFLYSAAVGMLREYITRGELGDIYYLHAQRLNLGRVRQDVNAMWNLAPHDVSIILNLLDAEPVAVSAKGLTFLQAGIPDVVFLNLDFDGGASAHVHLSWLDPNKVRRMTVVGSKKMAVYDDGDADAPLRIFDKGITRETRSPSPGTGESPGAFTLIHRTGDVLVPRVAAQEPLLVECGHFIECITDRRTPKTDGRNGLRVVRVLEAAQHSLTNKGISCRLPGGDHEKDIR